jgi:hypothetical protein
MPPITITAISNRVISAQNRSSLPAVTGSLLVLAYRV